MEKKTASLKTGIQITQEIVAEMRSHAKRAIPNKCCGLLAGYTSPLKQAIKFFPMPNANEDRPQDRFQIDPADYLRVEKEAEAAGLQIVAVYHSHLNQPARPSQGDWELAQPFWSYLIVNLEKGQPKKITSWCKPDFELPFEEESFEVID